MPTLRLPYGRSVQEVSLPDAGFIGVLEPRLEAAPAGPAAIDRALDEPIGSRSFQVALRGVRRVTIVIPDRTRASAQERYVPLLVRRLGEAGIAPERVSILFATGTHRGHSPEERAAMVGALPAGVALVDHDGSDRSAMVRLGATPRGTPVAVHRLAAETDLLVLTGTLSYHYLAGYGGGRKCFAPGVAAHATCVALHRWTLDPAGRSLRHPACLPGRLADNPFHQELLAACALAPVRPFLLNTLLAPDGAILDAVGGDVCAAHEEGARRWDRRYRVAAGPSADLVVASCGGHPGDLDLYQAHKSALHASRALCPGGTLILLAACEGGPGGPAFTRWFDLPTIEAHAAAVRADFAIAGQTAWSLRDLAARFRLVLVSGLESGFVARTGMLAARTAREAVEEALRAGVAISCAIPDAGRVLPEEAA